MTWGIAEHVVGMTGFIERESTLVRLLTALAMGHWVVVASVIRQTIICCA